MATIEYSYNESRLSSEQKEYLLTEVEKCSTRIRQLINNKEYQHLTLSVRYILEEYWGTDGDKVIIVSNADFGIPKSYSYIEKLKNLLSDINIPSTITKCRLKVSISFGIRKQEDKVQNQYKREQESESKAIFTPIQPRYTFSQLIIPDSVREEILNALSVIKNKKLIYEDWGFGAIEPTPRSILNFYGEPGTGKSMCAHAIASELGRPLLALNYADIESKYVGEAAKNLKKAFETAKEKDAVMFFDEADSFLGKRIENVTTGSDQALNSLRSQMLIYLEEFSGVVLFATNLVTNFDRAFESRILNHIKFDLPNREARAAIIETMIPTKLPKDRDFTKEYYLSISDLIEGLSGREIKTAIQSMLLNGAQKNGANAIFTVDLLKDALVRKKESKDQLKKEENERLKRKIAKKLQEKELENKAEVESSSIQTKEQEYLEAYQEANENGQISDKERRILYRLRDMLGISEERAKKIESTH